MRLRAVSDRRYVVAKSAERFFSRDVLLSLGQSLEGISQGTGPALERRRADSTVRRVNADPVGTDIQQDSLQVGNDFVIFGVGQDSVVLRHRLIWLLRRCGLGERRGDGGRSRNRD